MADPLKPGDHVTWDTSQGTTEGTVERKLTGETRIKGFTAKASPDDPQYLVRSDKTGAKAAHKPGELRKAGGRAAKTAAKKTTAKQAPARKTAAKSPVAKKMTAKRAAARKTPGKQAARRTPGGRP